MEEKPLADELLVGVNANAAFSGFTPRQIYDGAPKGRFPLFKERDQWIGTKTGWRRYVEKRLEAAGAKQRENAAA